MIRNTIEYLVRTSETYPNKIAFVDEKKAWTFAEVNTLAQKIASVITVKLDGKINQPVAVYMEKSVECIIAFFGILYSGNFYSPLDVKMPVARIKKVMDVLEPAALIYRDMLIEGIDIPTISFADVDEIDVNDSAILNYKKVLDIDPIYTLFTSGSTGQPKGVVISHRGVIDYVEWLHDKFKFNEQTVFGNQAPFYFDNSIFDIYSTIKNGSTMVILPEKGFVFPGKLFDYMNEYNVNTIFWVPSALTSIANSNIFDEKTAEGLEKVLFCGEVMPSKVLNIWRKKYPQVLYANLYGPTEITDVCSCYIVEREFDDTESLPIGKACENTDLIILTDEDKTANYGELGELCVRGSGVAMGYFGDAERTNQVFVQNPLNNKYRDIIYRTGDMVKLNDKDEILYVGRKDFQIKHQGHRIELGEIESATSSISGVQLCGAIYDDVNKKIVIYASTDGMIDEKGIYRSLKKLIPMYMLPSEIEILEEMPLNINGKIDRVELKRRCMNSI